MSNIAAAYHPNDKVYFGFWLYLMTDLIVFSVAFTTFAVLRTSTHGGPTGAELFDLPFVLIETMLLLVSSFTCGMAILAARRLHKNQALAWLIATALLGLGFLGMELSEFGHLIAEGYDWQRSAFLSAFFTLVGTHGVHITVGLSAVCLLCHLRNPHQIDNRKNKYPDDIQKVPENTQKD